MFAGIKLRYINCNF